MRKITTNSSEEFHRTMAQVKANGWRITALTRGRGNASWILDIDDSTAA
jgi:hypothetical protein